MSFIKSMPGISLGDLGEVTINQVYTDDVWSIELQIGNRQKIFPGYYDHDTKYEAAANILYVQALCNKTPVVWAMPLDDSAMGYANTINALMQTVVDTSHHMQFSLDDQEFLFCMDSWYPVKSIVDKGSCYEVQGFGLAGTVRVPKEKTTLGDTSLKETATRMSAHSGIKTAVSPAPKPAVLRSSEVALGGTKTALFAEKCRSNTSKVLQDSQSTPDTELTMEEPPINPNLRQYMNTLYHVLSTRDSEDWKTTIAGRDMPVLNVPGCANRVVTIGNITWAQLTNHMEQRLYVVHSTQVKFMEHWNKLMSQPFGKDMGFFVTPHYVILELPTVGVTLECDAQNLDLVQDEGNQSFSFILPIIGGKTLKRDWKELSVPQRKLIGQNLQICVSPDGVTVLDQSGQVLLHNPIAAK